MTNRQVREDEIARLGRAIQVGDTCDWHTSQNRAVGSLPRVTAVGEGAGILQRSKEEEVGIVRKGNIGFVDVSVRVGLVYTQFNDRRRVDWAPVGG